MIWSHGLRTRVSAATPNSRRTCVASLPVSSSTSGKFRAAVSHGSRWVYTHNCRHREAADRRDGAIGPQRPPPCFDGLLHEQRRRLPRLTVRGIRLRYGQGEFLGLCRHPDRPRPCRAAEDKRILSDCIERKCARRRCPRYGPQADSLGISVPEPPLLDRPDRSWVAYDSTHDLRPACLGGHRQADVGEQTWRHRMNSG